MGSTDSCEELPIDCHLQHIGQGTLICRGAAQGDHRTNEVTSEICAACDVGKIFREVGCDASTAKILVWRMGGGSQAEVDSILCVRRKRETSLEYCRTCDIVVAPTTRTAVTGARGLFADQDFYTAYQDLEKARQAIRDGKLDDSITASVASLESTMRVCHERFGASLPDSKDVTGLWKSTRELLRLQEYAEETGPIGLLNTLAGAVGQLGNVRNQLSDAHGKGVVPPTVTEAVAELAITTSAALSTFIVRCFAAREKERAADGD
ncbi:abortive infection family protein [bacterium]|nr:abortive infection family protein [bacterium]